MATADPEARLKKIIAEQLGVSEDEVVPEASFIEDLNADSLEMVDLIISLEEEFADVLSYLLDLANCFQVDLEQAFRAKEQLNQSRTWES